MVSGVCSYFPLCIPVVSITCKICQQMDSFQWYFFYSMKRFWRHFFFISTRISFSCCPKDKNKWSRRTVQSNTREVDNSKWWSRSPACSVYVFKSWSSDKKKSSQWSWGRQRNWLKTLILSVLYPYVLLCVTGVNKCMA